MVIPRGAVCMAAPLAPPFQPQTLFLFSWTRFPLAHEKRLWGAPGLITRFVPSCDNRPEPIAGLIAAGLGPVPAWGL